MQFTADYRDETLYLSWSDRSPQTERDLHFIGGHWETFNTYRFSFDEVTIKKVLTYAKRNGTLLYTEGTSNAIMETVKKSQEAEKLTRSDADAEISPYLADYPSDLASVLRPYQRAGVKFLATNDSSLLADQPGLGKAQPLSSVIYTTEGKRTMRDVRLGDFVFGADGKPAEVTGVFPQGQREVVKVTFDDGAVVRCDYDHLWSIEDRRFRTNKSKKNRVLTVREMLSEGLVAHGASRFSVLVGEAVEFPPQDFFLDPYTCGVLLGDGSLSDTHHASITTDKEIVESLVLPEGCEAVLANDHEWYGEYRLNGLSRIMRQHRFNGCRSEGKEIPTELLYGSISQRIALLQGLMDTDGTVSKSRNGFPSASTTFGTTSKVMAYQFVELVQSLGGIAKMTTKDPWFTYNGEKRSGQRFYQVHPRFPSWVEPFRLSKKKEKYTPATKYAPTRRIIRSIEPDGMEECQCIMVNNDSHLYLTDGYIPTHNTVQAIASLISANVKGDILVLAPTVAANISWPAELRRWAPKDEVLPVMGDRKKREAALAQLRKESKADRRWVLCNTEMVRTEYIDKHIDEEGKAHKATYQHNYPELFYLTKEQKAVRKWAAIIVDEAHNSLITAKSQPYQQTLTRRGFSKLNVADKGKRIAISGTPFRGKPENLWGILNWLYPQKYKSYWKWAEKWFEIKKGYFGGVEDMALRETQKMAFYKSIQPIMIRRTKQEVAPDLPPKMYAGTVPPGVLYDEPSQRQGLVGHWLEMSPKQQRAYDEMETYATAALDNGTLVANGVLSELTRLKQFATSYGRLDTKIDSEGFEVPTFTPGMPSNKFEWLVEFLKELGIDGKPHEDARKVVIASQFTSIIDLFADELEKKMKLRVLKITGKVSQADREKAVDLFQNDDSCQVLMLNTKAGGVALTLDRADDMVILDETFIPDDQTQVEDRIHRVSRMHNVTIHYVRSLGTIEEKIAKKTIDRDNLQKQLLDGARGVSYARHLLGE